jgi:hypothetical protein
MFVGSQAVCLTTGRGLGQAEQALEVLASVQASRERPFLALQELVLRHAKGVCGCVCVFLAWDEPRRELVRQLSRLGLPVLVLVVVEAGRVASVDKHPNSERPEHFHILEAGRISEGLQQVRLK